MTDKKETLSEKIVEDNDYYKFGYIQIEDVKEFIKRREARLRNQIRIHWGWLKNKSQEEVAEWVVTIANAEAGEELT